jgi:hypothetical protein
MFGDPGSGGGGWGTSRPTWLGGALGPSSAGRRRLREVADVMGCSVALGLAAAAGGPAALPGWVGRLVPQAPGVEG